MKVVVPLMSFQDGNGNISRSELRHVMMNMGEKISEEECSYLVEVVGDCRA